MTGLCGHDVFRASLMLGFVMRRWLDDRVDFHQHNHPHTLHRPFPIRTVVEEPGSRRVDTWIQQSSHAGVHHHVLGLSGAHQLDVFTEVSPSLEHVSAIVFGEERQPGPTGQVSLHFVDGLAIEQLPPVTDLIER